ncbi:MAG: FAD-dependent monooxygenase [Bifidobacteriaceae bacterium]|jgi:salicylate hydroxylase|nr:FAD-dependent monooxygenase [Bifidobacteriaceae bacterium]
MPVSPKAPTPPTTDPHDAQVVIAGGGIGGAGAALVLGLRGIRVTLLEKAQEYKEVGAGLQFGPNITRMMQKIGIWDRIEPLVVYPNRVEFHNAVSGDLIGRLDLVDMRQHYGSPYVVVHRNDLLQTLVQAAQELPTVTLLTAHGVTGFEDIGDGVQVRTATGETFRGQVLLGADGAHSVVRQALVGDDVQNTGYVAYRGAIAWDDMPEKRVARDAVVCWAGPGLHLMQYPLRGGTLFNQVAVFRSPSFETGNPDWGNPEELDAAFGPMCEIVRNCIPGLARIKRWVMADRKPLDGWTRGRVAMLGDAAHATLQYLAQGAGQSLLDGACLARLLGGLGAAPWTSDDVARVWRQYEAERLATASRVQTWSRTWGEMWHVSSYADTLLRDEAFRAHDPYDYSLMDWMYKPQD